MEIKTVMVERIEITCSHEDRRVALDHAWSNGYKVIFSGPKHLGAGEYDLDKFELVAEKEIMSRKKAYT